MMRLRLGILFFALAFASPSFAKQGDWALIGLRSQEGPSQGETLALARASLAAALGSEGRVLTQSETLERLGGKGATLEELEVLIAEAELYFFQLDHDSARAALRGVLPELTRQVGVDAWSRVRTVRLLLALIELQSAADSRQAGLEWLLPLAGVQPMMEFDERATPLELRRLWDEAREASRDASEGWLRVECMKDCPAGQVWVESFPVGVPGQAIALPPGEYRLILGDAGEAPRTTSFGRTIRIRAGEETKIEVEWGVEGSMQPHDGPSFLVKDEKAGLDAAAHVARTLGAERLVAVRMDSDGDRETLVAWILDASGSVIGRAGEVVERGGDREAKIDELMGSLVAASGKSPGTDHEDDAPFISANAQLLHRDGLSPSYLSAAKWTSIGLTAVLAGAATWLTLRTSADKSSLRRLETIPGGYGTLEDARRAEGLSSSIRTQETWGTVLWSGAAVGAAAAAVLILSDTEKTPIH